MTLCEHNRVRLVTIDAEPPLAFFRKIGVELENRWSAKRQPALGVTFAIVYSLYALRSFGKGIVDFWLVAVIPAAMHPFFGGKVWCR